MKNIIKLFGLVTLVVFSFFYTDKVIEVIREEDSIMIELKNMEDLHRIDAIDANVVANTIIPGLNGKSINLDKSYKEMKNIGVVNNNMIVYDTIKPTVSISNNKDKFIIKGNSIKQLVSLIFILNDDKYLNKLENILNKKNIVVNYFVDYNYLVNNTTKIKNMKNREFYSYGNNGKYTPDNLLFSNNLITRISNNSAIFCLDSTMSNDVISLCSDNDLYTITPSMVIEKNLYKSIKDNLSSGSIVLIDINKDNINNLNTVIEYIEGKGLMIAGLSKHITEELNCD